MRVRRARWVSKVKLLCGLVVLLLVGAVFPSERITFAKLLTFNVYHFNVNATDTGATRQLRVEASRGTTLLTVIRVVTDGTVTGAQVADLDHNHFPEVYIFTSSDGSGSLGRVYGWQFLAQRKAEIKSINWNLTDAAYMGHDSLWVENDVLCRQYPLYKPGDSNAQPTGGKRTIRYQLVSVGADFALKASSQE